MSIWRGHLCHSKRNGVMEIQLLVRKDSQEGLWMIPQRQILQFISENQGDEIQLMDEEDKKELDAFIKRESEIQAKLTTYEDQLRRCYYEVQ